MGFESENSGDEKISFVSHRRRHLINIFLFLVHDRSGFLLGPFLLGSLMGLSMFYLVKGPVNKKEWSGAYRVCPGRGPPTLKSDFMAQSSIFRQGLQ